MHDAPDLRALQSWMQEVIRDPAGAGAALTSGRTPGSVGRATAQEMIVGSPSMEAVERLELYNRQFRSRMLSCLRQTYPAVRYALGGDLFDEFAVAYVSDRPSRSYTLHGLRDGFAAYVKDTQGGMTGPSHYWADFVVDLAQLERSFHVVYDGPGTERGPGGALSLSPQDGWDASVAEPHPSLHLVAARFPIGPYFHAARRREQPVMPQPAASFIAVTRRDYAVVLVELDAPRFRALNELRSGRTLGEVMRGSGLSEDVVTKWLREWEAQALIVGVSSVRAGGRGGSAVETQLDSAATGTGAV